MKSGHVYLAATGSIGVIGAVFIGLTYPYPVIMIFFSVFGFLPPFLVFLYLGVLELVWGSRSGGVPPRLRDGLVLVANEPLEVAGVAQPGGMRGIEELATRPEREAA